MITLLAGILAFSALGGVTIQDEGAWIRYNIRVYAEQYGVDEGDALAVAYCESRFSNVPSVNKWEDSFGVYQEGSEFWRRQAKRFGLPTDPRMRKSIEANISLALRVASIDGWGEWSCKPGSKDVLQQRAELKKILDADKISSPSAPLGGLAVEIF